MRKRSPPNESLNESQRTNCRGDPIRSQCHSGNWPFKSRPFPAAWPSLRNSKSSTPLRLVSSRQFPSILNEIHTAFDQSVRSAEKCLSGMSETAALGTWRLTLRGKELFTKPRVGLRRSVMLNHWYHHRGQLSVYLRLLDVPVPVIYGRTADENPFACIFDLSRANHAGDSCRLT